MQTIGVLLLAAATAGDGFGYDKPGVGLKKWLRPHAVVSAACPAPGGPAVHGRDHGRRPRRHGHGRRRPPVRQYQEPDLLPRSRRHERRLAERHRPERRTDLPGQPARRPCPL